MNRTALYLMFVVVVPAAEVGIMTQQVWTGPDVQTSGSVSPDGRFVSYSDPRTQELALRNLSTGEVRMITNEKGQARSGADFSIFSPDGKQVAYVWFKRPGFWELRVLGLHDDARAKPRVICCNPEARHPGPRAWSADGKWIGVQLLREVPGVSRTIQIALVSPTDGSVRVLKTLDLEGGGMMAFSPDGKYLAYDVQRSESDPRRSIMVIATDVSREFPAASDSNSDERPVAWTPDGKHLLFKSDRSGTIGLWAMPMSDGKRRGAPKLVKADFGGYMGLTLSGTLFYGVQSGGTELYTASIDLESGKLRSAPVLESTGNPSQARWSPDGKSMAYRTNSHITIRSAGSSQIRVVRPKLRLMNGDHEWAPDSRFLAASGSDFKGRQGIYRIDLQTGDAELIVTETATSGVAFAFGPQWSPDGKKLFYLRSSNHEQIHSGFTEGILMEHDIASRNRRELRRIGLPERQFLTFNLSPDGHYIRYSLSERNSGEWSVMLLPVKGGEPRELPRFRGDIGPWTPDGRYLIRKSLSENGQGEFWLWPVGSGEPRKIGINNGRVTGISIHPKGNQIAYLIPGNRKSEVLALKRFLPTLKTAR
jgi:Tol biopolymer transport system component